MADPTHAQRVFAGMLKHNCVCPGCLKTHLAQMYYSPRIDGAWCSSACLNKHRNSNRARRHKTRRRWRIAREAYGF